MHSEGREGMWWMDFREKEEGEGRNKRGKVTTVIKARIEKPIHRWVLSRLNSTVLYRCVEGITWCSGANAFFSTLQMSHTACQKKAALSPRLRVPLLQYVTHNQHTILRTGLQHHRPPPRHRLDCLGATDALPWQQQVHYHIFTWFWRRVGGSRQPLRLSIHSIPFAWPGGRPGLCKLGCFYFWFLLLCPFSCVAGLSVFPSPPGKLILLSCCCCTVVISKKLIYYMDAIHSNTFIWFS